MPPPLLDPEFRQERLAMFGERLRRLRTWRGYSQQLLAQNSGLTRDYIAKLEAGRMSPGLLRLWDIADALGIQLPELLGDKLPESWAGARGPWLHQMPTPRPAPHPARRQPATRRRPAQRPDPPGR
jgi:transcriptional regulator with XRE-family HTH domain